MRECTTEVFLKDVASHEMVVVHDCGNYRHVRFQQPKNNHLWFELVTWPGVLTIHGDMGTWAFSRIPDMFNFFRSREDLKINPSYWSEKLQHGVHGNSDLAQMFSMDSFRRSVVERLVDYELDPEKQKEILEALESEVFCHGDSEHLAWHSLWEFKCNGFTFDPESIPSGKVYRYHFIWCLYAIVWGIQQYDAHKATSEAA